jgi:uncharacterized protein YceK
MSGPEMYLDEHSHLKGEENMKIITVIMICAVFVSGCASIFHGTDDTVYVRSSEPDTTFYANNREIGKGSSATVTIPKKRLDATVLRGEKAGCNAKAASIETKFDAITLLGVLIDWGLISILVIDWGINGATVRVAQNDYVLTPECATLSQKLMQPELPSQPPVPQPQASQQPAQM